MGEDEHERAADERPGPVKYYTDRIALTGGRARGARGHAIAYRLSPDASYLTCATLLVDGGFVVNAEL